MTLPHRQHPNNPPNLDTQRSERNKIIKAGKRNPVTIPFCAA
jgi:hypothetical protein